MDRQDWDERYKASELVWSAEPNRWVEEELSDQPPGRALDLAAGEGRNSIWLASLGWQVTAVDYSPVALDKGRRLAEQQPIVEPGRIEWTVADVRSWRASPGTYDLVLLSYLHLPADERSAALEGAAEAVAPGGMLLVVAHALSNLTDGTGGPRDPSVLYEPEDVVAGLPPGSGLVVERAEQVRRPVEGERDAIDVLVRARRSR